MRIFEFERYKSFIDKKISLLPGKGRGELTRIAKALDIHTTMVSHILRGEAHLTMEQSLKLADYFSLNSLETEYLVALVQWERAGDKRTRDFCLGKVNEIRTKALNLTKRLNTQNQLSEQDRAFYYSSWLYPMTRLCTAIPRLQTVESLAQELRLPANKLRDVTDFLISRGLCVEEKGKIKYGSVPTYIEASSPLVIRHHLNWRHKTQERFEQIRDKDLVFTLPGVLSDADADRIREKLVQVIEEIKTLMDPSPSDELYILNLDWLKLTSS